MITYIININSLIASIIKFKNKANSVKHILLIAIIPIFFLSPITLTNAFAGLGHSKEKKTEDERYNKEILYFLEVVKDYHLANRLSLIVELIEKGSISCQDESINIFINSWLREASDATTIEDFSTVELLNSIKELGILIDQGWILDDSVAFAEALIKELAKEYRIKDLDSEKLAQIVQTSIRIEANRKNKSTIITKFLNNWFAKVIRKNTKDETIVFSGFSELEFKNSFLLLLYERVDVDAYTDNLFNIFINEIIQKYEKGKNYLKIFSAPELALILLNVIINRDEIKRFYFSRNENTPIRSLVEIFVDTLNGYDAKKIEKTYYTYHNYLEKTYRVAYVTKINYVMFMMARWSKLGLNIQNTSKFIDAFIINFINSNKFAGESAQRGQMVGLSMMFRRFIQMGIDFKNTKNISLLIDDTILLLLESTCRNRCFGCKDKHELEYFIKCFADLGANIKNTKYMQRFVDELFEKKYSVWFCDNQNFLGTGRFGPDLVNGFFALGNFGLNIRNYKNIQNVVYKCIGTSIGRMNFMRKSRILAKDPIYIIRGTALLGLNTKDEKVQRLIDTWFEIALEKKNISTYNHRDFVNSIWALAWLDESEGSQFLRKFVKKWFYLNPTKPLKNVNVEFTNNLRSFIRQNFDWDTPPDIHGFMKLIFSHFFPKEMRRQNITQYTIDIGKIQIKTGNAFLIEEMKHLAKLHWRYLNVIELIEQDEDEEEETEGEGNEIKDKKREKCLVMRLDSNDNNNVIIAENDLNERVEFVFNYQGYQDDDTKEMLRGGTRMRGIVMRMMSFFGR